jgi:hypothetical protein
MKRLDVHATLFDGTELKATTALRDYILFETTAKRQKPPWGGITENPTRWEAFVSWAALRRTGQYTGGFDQFLDEVEVVDASSEEDVDPTNQAATEGS